MKSMFVLTEAIASVLAIISPFIPNTLVGYFIVSMILKLIIIMHFDLDEDKKLMLFLTSVNIFYNSGVLMRFLYGEIKSVKDAAIELFFIGIFISLGVCFCKFIIYREKEREKEKTFSKILVCLIIFFISNIVLFALFAVTDNGELIGDGSIYIFGKVNIQLPELFKLMLIVLAYFVSKCYKEKRFSIWLLYITSVITAVIFLVIFRENGTSIILIYFTLVIAFIITAEPENKLTIKDIFTSKIVPIAIFSLFYAVTGIVKQVLNQIYPLRGSAGEQTYRTPKNELEKLFSYSSRFSADSSQLIDAREKIASALAIQINLNTRDTVIYDQNAHTSLSDYCIVMLSQTFGWLIAAAIIIFFVISLVVLIWKRGDILTKASAVMLLSQIFVQFQGIELKFLFTGVNIPFISPGGSSLFSSTVMLTFIAYSLRRKNYEDNH